MRNARGFTLIELMIVVSILAILIAIALPAYQKHRGFQAFDSSVEIGTDNYAHILVGQGYTDITILGQKNSGCLSGESDRIGFTARDVAGRRITGTVCSGPGLGKTVRLD